MNCATAEKWIDRYVDGELPQPQRRALEEHIAGCAACAEQVGALRRLTLATQAALPDRPLPADFDAAVLGAVTAQGRHRPARRTSRPTISFTQAAIAFFEHVARCFGIVGEWFRDIGKWRF